MAKNGKEALEELQGNWNKLKGAYQGRADKVRRQEAAKQAQEADKKAQEAKKSKPKGAIGPISSAARKAVKQPKRVVTSRSGPQVSKPATTTTNNGNKRPKASKGAIGPISTPAKNAVSGNKSKPKAPAKKARMAAAPKKKSTASKKKSGVQLMNPKAAKIVREARMKQAVAAGRKKSKAAPKRAKKKTGSHKKAFGSFYSGN